MSSSHKISDRPRNRELGRAMAAMPEPSTSSKPRIAKRGQYRFHDFVDNWFRTADGQIVIAQVPNIYLLIFIFTSIFGAVSYHGFWQSATRILAMVSIAIWAILESRSGVNRFRRLLGKVILACTVLTLIMYFWK
jgi:hypothetical protein